MAIKKTTAKPVKKAAVKSKADKKPVKLISKKANVKSVDKKTLIKPLKAKAGISKTAFVKKNSSPVKKMTPVKKTVKPVVKKAVPKKSTKPIKKVTTPIKKVKQAKASVPDKKIQKPQPKIADKSVAKKKDLKNTEMKVAPSAKPLPKAKDIKVPQPKVVMLPKLTTTKSRKYEPDFTKSVLDHAPLISNGPTMRYSDTELNEFRDLIQRKLETAKKELGYLQGLITRKDQMGGDDTDNRYMTMEDGSLSMEREQLSQMASRQITFIDHLEKAMMRIENKTYGICRVTGKLIDKARLRAVPHATLSIEAKMGIAK